VIGRAGVNGSGLNIENPYVFEERVREKTGVIRQRFALFLAAADGFVVYVREVHDMRNVVTPVLQPPLEEVFEDKSTEVTYVRVIVDSRSASVQAHFACRDRFERLFLPGQSVEKPNFGGWFAHLVSWSVTRWKLFKGFT